MSSKLSPAGVADLLKAAQDLRIAETHIARECAQLVALKDSLEKHQADRASAASAITKMLTAMDCASNGNCGWEGRIVYMLGELVDQAERSARANP